MIMKFKNKQVKRLQRISCILYFYGFGVGVRSLRGLMNFYGEIIVKDC